MGGNREKERKKEEKGERKRKTKWVCCRKGNRFQDEKVVSCLTLRNECLRRHTCGQSKSFY